MFSFLHNNYLLFPALYPNYILLFYHRKGEKYSQKLFKINAERPVTATSMNQPAPFYL